MRKQFEAKVALLSARSPGISLAIGDCIGAFDGGRLI
jgi:hypothetical protein